MLGSEDSVSRIETTGTPRIACTNRALLSPKKELVPSYISRKASIPRTSEGVCDNVFFIKKKKASKDLRPSRLISVSSSSTILYSRK